MKYQRPLWSLKVFSDFNDCGGRTSPLSPGTEIQVQCQQEQDGLETKQSHLLTFLEVLSRRSKVKKFSHLVFGFKTKHQLMLRTRHHIYVYYKWYLPSYRIIYVMYYIFIWTFNISYKTFIKTLEIKQNNFRLSLYLNPCDPSESWPLVWTHCSDF